MANARFFYEYINREITRAQRHAQSFSLAYIDLDNFKNINDQKGHSAGDELLHKLAQTLKNNIRSIDMVARMGGEETPHLLMKLLQKQTP